MRTDLHVDHSSSAPAAAHSHSRWGALFREQRDTPDSNQQAAAPGGAAARRREARAATSQEVLRLERRVEELEAELQRRAAQPLPPELPEAPLLAVSPQDLEAMTKGAMHSVFNGVWSKGTIQGDQLTFVDGESTVMEFKYGCRDQFAMMWHGKRFSAKFVNGVIKWNDGDEWTLIQAPSDTGLVRGDTDCLTGANHAQASKFCSKHVAVKLYASKKVADPEAQLNLLRDIQSYRRCPHSDNLVPLLAICLPSLACVLPWASGGSLEGVLRGGDAPRPGAGFRIIGGVARGLAALHAHRLVHRDVRSAHVLLFEDSAGEGATARLSGCRHVISAEAAAQSPPEVVGVPPYVDPRYLSSGRFQLASDVFSLGVVALELLLGRLAPQPAEPREVESPRMPSDPINVLGRGAPAGATRRMRERPFWAPFDGLMFDSPQVAGQAAAAQVLRERRRPDWCQQALEGACGLITSMLRVGVSSEDASTAGRPVVDEVADCFDVFSALQEEVPEPAQRNCLVCMSEPIDTQFRPCRHSCTCQACAALFVAGPGRPCPICRKHVTSFQFGVFESTYVGATLPHR